MKQAVIDWIKSFYYSSGGFDTISYENHSIYWCLGLFVCLVIGSMIAWFLSRFVMLQALNVAASKTKTHWDDYLVKNKFFKALAHLIPLFFMEYLLSIVFYQYPNLETVTDKLVVILIIIVVIVSVSRFLSTVRDIITEVEQYRDKPIQSYFQVLKIVLAGVGIAIMLSVLTERSPIYFLTSLGAVSAVLLLVFKDTILGFVGSLQLAANDMIRIGDWVTMDRFGADGEVEEINLATVKVRNFDKTITTIPTYSFISDSFKNWRGMQESGGRRITRSVKITIDSVRFVDEKLMQELKKIAILKDFLEQREKEIQEYNAKHNFDENQLVNARRQTNIGVFRKYVEYYLQQKDNVNENMTLMVRQLDPTEHGIPLEVYCFSKTKIWEEYELLISDIFDHIYCIIKVFDLEIFERPSGRDFRMVNNEIITDE